MCVDLKFTAQLKHKLVLTRILCKIQFFQFSVVGFQSVEPGLTKHVLLV